MFGVLLFMAMFVTNGSSVIKDMYSGILQNNEAIIKMCIYGLDRHTNMIKNNHYTIVYTEGWFNILLFLPLWDSS